MTPSCTGAKVLVVEDEDIVALDLQETLVDLGYHVVGVAGSGPKAIRLIKEHDPNVVLLDIHLRGEMDGIAVAASVTNRQSTAVIFLSAHTDDSTFQRAMGTRPYGFLAKPFSKNDLDTTVRLAIAQHGNALATELTLDPPAENSSTTQFLTNRELEVLRLTASGISRKEMAHVLAISEKTVAFHKDNLKKKLGLDTTAALTRYALDRRLI
jgi:DNA-binding NarL/FixJ family response regulator